MRRTVRPCLRRTIRCHAVPITNFRSTPRLIQARCAIVADQTILFIIATGWNGKAVVIHRPIDRFCSFVFIFVPRVGHIADACPTKGDRSQCVVVIVAACLADSVIVAAASHPTAIVINASIDDCGIVLDLVQFATIRVLALDDCSVGVVVTSEFAS